MRIISIILVLAYFWLCSGWTKKWLINIFEFKKKAWRTRAIAIMLNFYTLSFIGGIFIFFSKLGWAQIGTIFILNGCLQFIFKGFGQTKNIPLSAPHKISFPAVKKTKIFIIIAVIAYLILFVAGLVILHSTLPYVSTFFLNHSSLSSPWQVIQGYYIYIFALASLILAGLIFSRLSTKTLLFLLILHSFLLHSYLPLTNELVWGADQWRHMAQEGQILTGQKVEVILYDDNPKTIIQRLNPGELSYNNLWTAESLLFLFTKFSLININKWLLVILFSFFVPLLIYEASVRLGAKRPASLLAVWLSFIFFPLQSLGAMTLPVSFGFIFWIFFLILLFSLLQKPSKNKRMILLCLSVLGLFGYALYFLLGWLAWLLAEIVIFFNKNSQSHLKKKLWSVLTGVIIGLVLPAFEFFTRYSYYQTGLVERLKTCLANFSGYYLSIGPLVNDAWGGNIVFNQVPYDSFVENFFTHLIILIPIIMLILFVFTIKGFFVLLKKDNLTMNFVAYFVLFIWISYLVGFYVLSGDRLLSRRLDMVLAISLLALISAGLSDFYLKISCSVRYWFKIFMIPFFCFILAMSYSLGPDAKSISLADFQAMRYVFEQVKDQNEVCVISDTMPLLALEYFSNKKIIGGGFPINENFAQPQRVDLYNSLGKKLTKEEFERGLILTKAEACFFVGFSQNSGLFTPVATVANRPIYMYNKRN